MAGPPPDYVDVAERIRMYYEKYPEGALRTVDHGLYQIGDKTFVWVKAEAHRDPADALPGVGLAWEPVPGPTPFTRDSEFQNAETSAWGRAIVALGFETKHIASADEVRNREGSGRGTASPTAAGEPDGAHTRPEESGQGSSVSTGTATSGRPPVTTTGKGEDVSRGGRPDENPLEPTALQHAKLNAMLAELEAKDPNPNGSTWLETCKDYVGQTYGKQSRTQLTRVEMTELIDTIQRWGYEKGIPF